MNSDKQKSIVKKYMGEDGAQLFQMLISQVPEWVDVIVFLQGDRLDRIASVQTLYSKGYGELILISGNNKFINRDKRAGEDDMNLLELKNWLVEHGIKEEAILIDNQSFNTKDQAMRVIALAKNRGWSRMLVVTSAYHAMRAYLTFLKQAEMQDWKGKIIMHAVLLPWDAVPGGREKTAGEMFEVEMEKIKTYL